MGKVVEDLKMKVEAPSAVRPAKVKAARAIFLSNIDHILVAPVGTLSFFSATPPAMRFEAVVESYKKALSKMLVTYDFMAGRLKLNEEGRLEIDCNGAGAFFAVASSELRMEELGDITTPNPEFRHLVLCDCVALSHDQDLPLFTLQATLFKCGGFVVGAGWNRCILDEISCFHMMRNLSFIARGKDLPITPFVDRTLLKARVPPISAYQHHEFSNAVPAAQDNVMKRSTFPISGEELKRLKEGWRCSSFEVVTALVWKARTAAVAENENEEESTTVLFPVDVRSKMEPALPKAYDGNAVFPGHAKAKIKKLRDMPLGEVVYQVQIGLRRISDDYVRSALDWLEVNKAVPCALRSFSVVGWWLSPEMDKVHFPWVWKLEMDKVHFPWGKPLHFGPAIFSHSQDVVLLLPHHDGHGVKIDIALHPSQMAKFNHNLRLLLA